MSESLTVDPGRPAIRAVLVWRLIGLLLVGLCLPQLASMIQGFLSYLQTDRATGMIQGPSGWFGALFDPIVLALKDPRFYSRRAIPAAGLLLGLYLVLTRARFALALTRRYVARCATTSGSS